MHNYTLKITILYLITIILTITNLNKFTSGLIFSSNIFIPNFEMMMIYYFSIYKNRVFGYWFIFFIGIWTDSLIGIPLGISSLSCLIVVKTTNIIKEKQPHLEDFKSILKEFITFIAFVFMLKWLFLSIYYKNLYNILPFFYQLLINSLTYVVMHKFFEFLNKKFLLKS